jgi:hypothetical protein
MSFAISSVSQAQNIPARIAAAGGYSGGKTTRSGATPSTDKTLHPARQAGWGATPAELIADLHDAFVNLMLRVLRQVLPSATRGGVELSGLHAA